MLMKQKSLNTNTLDSESKQDGDNSSAQQGNSHEEKNFYDKNLSFFDRISCEANEKTNKPKNWKEERKMNVETFGLPANNNRYGNYRPQSYGNNNNNNNNRNGNSNYYNQNLRNQKMNGNGNGNGNGNNRNQQRYPNQQRMTVGGGNQRNNRQQRNDMEASYNSSNQRNGGNMNSRRYGSR
jgi:hypothetical protein